jgi:HK97 family phage prohead protease
VETKDLNFKLFNIDEAEGVFKGYASVFDVVDSYNEVVTRGAFANSLRENDGKFPLCWFHNVAEPLGIVYAEESVKGLLVEGYLNLDVKSAREKYSLMKQGAVKGLSIGFKTLRDEWDGDLRRLKEIKLYEISPFTLNFQACPDAEIEDVKSILNGSSLVSKAQARNEFLEMMERRQRYFEELSEIHARIHKEARRRFQCR